MKPPKLCLAKFLDGRAQATCTRPVHARGKHRAEHPMSNEIVDAMNEIIRDADRRGIGVEVTVRLTRHDGRVCESRMTGAVETTPEERPE